MKKPDNVPYSEPRWPVVLAILAVLILLTLLPGRIRRFPAWSPFALGVMALTPIAGAAIAAEKQRWLRIEHAITLLFFLAAAIGTLMNLANLVSAMVRRPSEISGIQLLNSSIGVWVTNVIAFSLLYWQIDRGGPGSRANMGSTKPDWLFPQEGAPQDVAPDWRPTFVDYLFLGFSTATAFSPTDALPLTSRAKLLMMLESSISLATIVVVASRAINILGN